MLMHLLRIKTPDPITSLAHSNRPKSVFDIETLTALSAFPDRPGMRAMVPSPSMRPARYAAVMAFIMVELSGSRTPSPRYFNGRALQAFPVSGPGRPRPYVWGRYFRAATPHHAVQSNPRLQDHQLYGAGFTDAVSRVRRGRLRGPWRTPLRRSPRPGPGCCSWLLFFGLLFTWPGDQPRLALDRFRTLSILKSAPKFLEGKDSNLHERVQSPRPYH